MNWKPLLRNVIRVEFAAGRFLLQRVDDVASAVIAPQVQALVAYRRLLTTLDQAGSRLLYDAPVMGVEPEGDNDQDVVDITQAIERRRAVEGSARVLNR